MKRLFKLKIAAAIAAVGAAVSLVWWFSRGTEICLEKEGRLEITPVQVEKIRSIGQWEFLSVSDEEIADTIRHGFFGDDELARIYYGTLRIGIDLGEVRDDWFAMDGDTVVAKLPPVKLLDDNFIDEARTRSFIEDGKWTEADRAALTRKAEAMMRRRCLTRQNLDAAQKNAAKQVESMIKSMGFEYVRVTQVRQDIKQ